MVVFNCNACGEALKKNQVEKHYMTKCRSCNVLSCIDCGKDFWGNAYEQHTKCISEEEKYSGKNYVPKPGANKNEIKQLQWLQQVQQAIDKANTNPQLRDLLVRLKDYPNIPRKQNKFMNFLANSIKCRNPKVCNEAWKVLMENVEMPKPVQNGVNSNKSAANSETDIAGTAAETSSQTGHENGENGEATETNSKKLSKREKKEERKKKAHKNEKKDKLLETNNESKEKSKKRKRDAQDDAEEEEEVTSQNDSRLVEEDENAEESSEPVKKKFKTKFNWADVILQVVQAKGPEMKLKRLKKKVLAEYLAQGCTEKSEEKLWAKFDKRLKRHPNIKIIGDKVKLITVET